MPVPVVQSPYSGFTCASALNPPAPMAGKSVNVTPPLMSPRNSVRVPATRRVVVGTDGATISCPPLVVLLTRHHHCWLALGYNPSEPGLPVCLSLRSP